MRQLQATLTRIFIVLESESHGLSEIEKNFSAIIGYSNGFTAQNQVISKKKGLHQNWDGFFGQIRKFKRFFRPNHGNYFTTSAPKFLWGGCFHVFTKNQPQKHQKRAILHTLQANGGGGGMESSRPLLATLLKVILSNEKKCWFKISCGLCKTDVRLNTALFNHDNLKHWRLYPLCQHSTWTLLSKLNC